jgi:chromosome segregation ATPase
MEVLRGEAMTRCIHDHLLEESSCVQCHIDDKNAEIARLRAEVGRLQSEDNHLRGELLAANMTLDARRVLMEKAEAESAALREQLNSIGAHLKVMRDERDSVREKACADLLIVLRAEENEAQYDDDTLKSGWDGSLRCALRCFCDNIESEIRPSSSPPSRSSGSWCAMCVDTDLRQQTGAGKASLVQSSARTAPVTIT